MYFLHDSYNLIFQRRFASFGRFREVWIGGIRRGVEYGVGLDYRFWWPIIKSFNGESFRNAQAFRNPAFLRKDCFMSVTLAMTRPIVIM
jgi:hypothetical protein